jgi:hypothetical protein
VTLVIQCSGTNIILNWPGVTGKTYQLEYKDNLTDPTWTPVGSPMTGTGTLTLTNSSGTSPQRFFYLQLMN